MTNYSILEVTDPVPADIHTYSQKGFFFNEWEHLRQQDHGSFRLLTVLNHQTQQIDARCAFFNQPKQLISPRAAPFGSIEFSEYLPDSVLSALIDSLEADYQHIPGFSVRLINYPHCYAPSQADRLARHLIAKGYKLVAANLNAHLPICPEPFTTHLHPSKRRQLTKCKKAGLQFTDQPALTVAQIVEFITNSRQQQGYRLTLPPTRLAQLLTQFPEQFRVFAVQDKVAIAALTIAVRVRDDILYNFLPVDNLAYRALSPAVLLTAGLYEYGQTNGIQLLDLGVSLDANLQPKPGLIQFKRQLGAQESPKLTFEKCW